MIKFQIANVKLQIARNKKKHVVLIPESVMLNLFRHLQNKTGPEIVGPGVDSGQGSV